MWHIQYYIQYSTYTLIQSWGALLIAQKWHSVFWEGFPHPTLCVCRAPHHAIERSELRHERAWGILVLQILVTSDGFRSGDPKLVDETHMKTHMTNHYYKTSKPGHKNPFSPELQQTYPKYEPPKIPSKSFKSTSGRSKCPTVTKHLCQIWWSPMEHIIYQAKRMKESPFTLW